LLHEVSMFFSLIFWLDIVLEDVTVFENTPEGRRMTKLDQILLNGNNITMLIPGGEGPET